MIQSLKTNLIKSFSINYQIHFLISAVNCIQMILIDKTYIVHVLLICADWIIFWGGQKKSFDFAIKCKPVISMFVYSI